MNTQLVKSIIDVVRALPKAEQKLLIESLNQLDNQTQPTLEKIEEPIDEEALEVWRTLGDDAVPGCLDNPSINHDRYLYSQP